MKAGEEIIIEISPAGEVKISTRGFKGKACKDATKKLEEALGEVERDQETEEFYQQSQKIQSHHKA